MNVFYSPSTGGFYNDEINGINIPSDCVTVTEADYAALMDCSIEGKIIKPDANGQPIAVFATVA